jgi:hypothetical protein
MPPPLQAVGDRFLSMNHAADDAPCGQEHIKDSDQHDQALSIAHRKQRRINPDVAAPFTNVTIATSSAPVLAPFR